MRCSDSGGPTLIICIDVDYREAPGASGIDRACSGVAAGVVFSRWTDAEPTAEHTLLIPAVAPYESGAFYRRELPCIEALLAVVPERVDTVVVDGHVWLGDAHSPGLGAYLYESLGRAVPVVGVAKNRFGVDPGIRGAALEVVRGQSRRPLFVTAAGMDAQQAAEAVASMHGPHRLPTLLKRADQLCRRGP